MENTSTTSDAPAPADAPVRPAVPSRRTAGQWLWSAVVAAAVLVTGVVAGILGPLLAIACDSCQDGVRGPMRFGGEFALVWAAVPVVTLGSVIGTFLPRGGARVGGYGIGILVFLVAMMQLVGRYTT
ncbi:hypothetical protein [Streptomyces sp. URMC 124]|uniref:hypothetical protein n=1 Tax=Streptomyces sp. URMC 124 TaxID=3423405 RepID=UPI003F1D9117